MQEFGLDKPLWQQFFIYIGNVFQGDLGTSFANYPASVGSLIKAALPWSIAIMVPAIIIGWIVGNLLGAGGVQGRLAGPGRIPRIAVLLQRPAVRAGHHSAVPGRGEGASCRSVERTPSV